MHDGRVTVFDRRPRLRWIVPFAAGAAVAAVVIGAGAATADSGLPERTPAELLVALQQPQAQALSGTVSVSTDLGLPDLSLITGSAASGPAALLSGSNTVRVWSDGEERSRIDLLGSTDEFDVIRNGSDVWTWSSGDSEATHATLPDASAIDAKPQVAPDMTGLPSTPQEAADLVLSVLDPTTAVTTTGSSIVAGRPVYELVLTPKQDGTRVARVVVGVDAETNVPLSVRVYSTTSGTPAIDVAFTSVDFATPDASVFTFTPPPGATVTERDVASMRGRHDGPASAVTEPTVVGKGWTSVAVLPAPADGQGVSADGASGQLGDVLTMLPSVSGAWGSGHVLDGALFSAILSDDGRIAVGAVTPKVLEAALAAK
jgi:outer membrane lipoprotein-sorting protein